MNPDSARVLARLETERQQRLNPLPQLLDCKALQAELGVTRATAEAIMRRVPVVDVEGLRKVFVRRSDVLAYLEARTFDKQQVAA